MAHAWHKLRAPLPPSLNNFDLESMLALSRRVLAARFVCASPALLPLRLNPIAAFSSESKLAAMSKKMYVGNLSWDCKKEDLEEL